MVSMFKRNDTLDYNIANDCKPNVAVRMPILTLPIAIAQERQYRRTTLAADRSAWVHFVRDRHRNYREKERTYWETKIVSHAKDPKRLWATFDALLGRRRADRQPDVSLFLAEDFLSSFTDKINGIRLETAGAYPPVYPATDCRLSAMVPVTGTE